MGPGCAWASKVTSSLRRVHYYCRTAFCKVTTMWDNDVQASFKGYAICERVSMGISTPATHTTERNNRTRLIRDSSPMSPHRRAVSIWSHRASQWPDPWATPAGGPNWRICGSCSHSVSGFGDPRPSWTAWSLYRICTLGSAGCNPRSAHSVARTFRWCSSFWHGLRAACRCNGPAICNGGNGWHECPLRWRDSRRLLSRGIGQRWGCGRFWQCRMLWRWFDHLRWP